MRILLIYSSKYGATEICAKKIADNLDEKVDLINIKEKNNINLNKYDKVVIGSSVYAGNIDKNIKDFCIKNENAIKSKIFGIFISCMNSNNLTEYIQSAFSKEILDKALIIKDVGGAFYFSKMNFFEKFIIKKIAKSDGLKDKSDNAIDGKNDVDLINDDNIKDFCNAINEKDV
ncbi:MAG: flavodoxin [Clostridium butyricum]|nr:flavodoxin [Clostridium butyricum]